MALATGLAIGAAVFAAGPEVATATALGLRGIVLERRRGPFKPEASCARLTREFGG